MIFLVVFWVSMLLGCCEWCDFQWLKLVFEFVGKLCYEVYVFMQDCYD